MRKNFENIHSFAIIAKKPENITSYEPACVASPLLGTVFILTIAGNAAAPACARPGRRRRTVAIGSARPSWPLCTATSPEPGFTARSRISSFRVTNQSFLVSLSTLVPDHSVCHSLLRPSAIVPPCFQLNFVSDLIVPQLLLCLNLITSFHFTSVHRTSLALCAASLFECFIVQVLDCSR